MSVTAPQERTYQPRGAAEKLIYCRDRQVLIHGPVRTGKSIACLTKVYACAEMWPGMRALIVRLTRESLTETILQTWEDEVVPEGHPILTGAKRNIRQAYHFPNGSEVVVGGLDNPQKIMSGQYDLIYEPEATEIPEAADAQLRTRNLRFHMPFNQIIRDCNPDAATHWLKRQMDAGEITGFQAAFTDNPKYWDLETNDWTDPAGRELIATLDALPPVMRMRLRDGIWTTAEGAVYHSFNEARDVITPVKLQDHWTRHVGLDFGAVNTAALFYAHDPEADLYYLYREYHAGNRTAGQHTTYLRLGEERPFDVVGGARSEGQWRMEFAMAGLPVKEPRIREVEIGISRVYAQHLRGGIKVFDTCTGYLAQKTDYRYKAGTAEGKPVIENQNAYHFMDAERYIIPYLTETDARGGVSLLSRYRRTYN